MADLTTGKIAEVLFENSLETFESQDMMLDKVDFWSPDSGDLQNADNHIWRTVEQHAPIIDGFDLNGLETGIIEETYPAILGTPANDYVKMRADKLRDIRFWEQRGKASGRRQASNVNKAIVNAMITQGSMYIRSNATSGYNFIAEGQALMNERQGAESRRCFMLNDRETLAFSSDLAARQTVQGRPETDAWTKGQIGSNVAGFDVYTGSFLSSLDGGADPGTAVAGNQSFAPEGGSVDAATGVVTNVDYRSASIEVDDSSGYTVGDKVTFSNGGDPVEAVGLDDKTLTNQAMTFTIVAIADGTHVTVYPKPIAADDPALSTLEKAYANINTRILDNATVDRVNIDASVQTNLFWDMEAVEVIGGQIPAQLFKEFGGKKVLSSTMKNGQVMYMLYDGNIESLDFSFRLFTWNGITIRNPSQVGVATRF